MNCEMAHKIIQPESGNRLTVHNPTTEEIEAIREMLKEGQKSLLENLAKAREDYPFATSQDILNNTFDDID